MLITNFLTNISLNYRFGCCPDKETPASGNNNLGCCNVTKYGCCPDGIKEASSPNGGGIS